MTEPATAPPPDPAPDYDQATLRAVLTQTRCIAAVGVSTNPIRPSAYVARYLLGQGYALIGINPAYAGAMLGPEPVLASLRDIPPDRTVDMVDIFRRSDQAGAVVDEALEVLGPRGLKTIWMQIGVIDHAAARRAQAQGVRVIMNRCPKIEHQRLFGQLRIGGFATGVISSRLDRGAST